jgi:anaerobic ribonucleoside-triphosphate reductase activating protein
MEPFSLRLHHLSPSSRVNGPGSRFVIWTQGCSFNCPGCFNPETFPINAGMEYSVEALAGEILSEQTRIAGITLSGGEPLLQHRPLQRLLSLIHKSADLGVILFTGFTWNEIMRIPNISPFLSEVDLVISGRYQQAKRQAHHLIGSTNKTLHYLSARYKSIELDVPPSEVIISEDGLINISGIDPLLW